MTSAVSYRMRKWHDHWTIFLHFRGSVLPRTLLAVSLSTVLCYIYWDFALNKGSPEKGQDLMGNPGIYGYFMQTSGVLLAFTTSICYNRFWESLGLLVSWSQGLSYVASMILCFESDKKFSKSETHRWQAKLIHWVSILHAVGIERLYSTEGSGGAALDVLGGLTAGERTQLELAADQPAAVCHWINCQLCERTFGGGFDIPAPIAAQLWNVVGSSMVNYANAVKFAQNHVPLSFQQCLAASDVVMLFFTPLAIASFVPHLASALVLNFVCTLVYHSIYLADTSMQQPFGDKARDLPLVSLHRGFIDKVLTCLSYEVALELHQLYEESTRMVSIHPNRKGFCAVRMDSTVRRAGKAQPDTDTTPSETSALATPSDSGDTRIPVKSPLRKRKPETDSPGLQKLRTLRSAGPHGNVLVMCDPHSESTQELPFAKEVRLPPAHP